MKKRIVVITVGAYSSTLIRSLKIARWAAKRAGTDSVVQEGISYTLNIVLEERAQRKAARRAAREQVEAAPVQPAPVPA